MKKPRAWWKNLLVAVGVLGALGAGGMAIGHGGGLDASGCHHDYVHGGYHCHR